MTSQKGALSSAAESKQQTNADPEEALQGMEGSDEQVMFCARVPGRLRDAFETVCEREDVSMSWAVRQFMKQSVSDGETGFVR